MMDVVMAGVRMPESDFVAGCAGRGIGRGAADTRLNR